MGRKNRRRNKWLRRIVFFILVILVLIIVSHLYYTFTYPLSYRGLIKKYANEFNIDPYLISAIINVESNFNKDALSPKDARGLMQITTSTGEWGAKELNINNFTLDLLYDPEINIQIGTWYLKQLGKEFDNNLQLMLAAYNGGSGNVNKWLKNQEYCEDGKTLKKIPFKETEEYVEKVLKNYQVYKRIYQNVFNENMVEDKGDYLYFFHNFKKIVKSLMFIIN